MNFSTQVKSLRVLFLFFVVFTFSCSGNRVKPSEPPTAKVVDVPVAALKRQIKDVDHKARVEDKGPKKRIIILPFLDAGVDRPEATRLKAQIYGDRL